jgi:hypothetical protein
MPNDGNSIGSPIRYSEAEEARRRSAGYIKAVSNLKRQASPKAVKGGFFGASDDMRDAESISAAVPRKK